MSFVYQNLEFRPLWDDESATVVGPVRRDANQGVIIPESIEYFDEERQATRTLKVTTIESSAFAGCSGLTGSLTIPDSVSSIGKKAFSGCSGLTGRLILPHCISILEEEVFAGCSGFNGSITLPESLIVIRECAFMGCSGLSGPLIIPDSVIFVEKGAFSGCTGLTGPLSLGKSLTDVGNSAFDKKLIDDKVQAALKSLSTMPREEDLQNPWTDECGVQFSRDRKRLLKAPCNLQAHYSIPQDTTTICDAAFENCELLARIDFPDSVIAIGKDAFAHCRSLAWVNLSDSVISIGEYAFSDCESLINITLPNSLKVIRKHAFYNSALAEITIPRSVLFIDNEAFEFRYHGSYKITLLNSATKLAPSAFNYGDTEFELSYIYGQFSVPNGTLECFRRVNGDEPCLAEDKDIPNEADLADGWTDEHGVLYSRDRKRLLKVPKSLGAYTIPTGTEVIGHEAFAGSAIAKLTIPDSVTAINDRAFCQCEQLVEINIPNSVAKIGRSAFSQCRSLIEFVIPEAIDRIDSWMFYGCESLVSVTLPSNLIGIEDGAFYGCTALKNIELPNSTNWLGEQAFAYCNSLTKVVLPGTLYIGICPFYRCKKLKKVVLPNSISEIYPSDELHPITYLFEECESLKSVFYHKGTPEQTLSYIGREYRKFLIPYSAKTAAGQNLSRIFRQIAAWAFNPLSCTKNGRHGC